MHPKSKTDFLSAFFCVRFYKQAERASAVNRFAKKSGFYGKSSGARDFLKIDIFARLLCLHIDNVRSRKPLQASLRLFALSKMTKRANRLFT